MSKVFISYAHLDQPMVARLVEALRSDGVDVWWDPSIVPGTEFARVIEDALSGAKCVVVVWSPRSLKSGWVKDEASEALKHAKLVPVTIDAVHPPLGFRQVQAVDLTDWDGDRKDRRYISLVAGVRSFVEEGRLPEDSWPSSLPPLSMWHRHLKLIIGASMTCMLLVTAGWYWLWPAMRTFSIYRGYQIYDAGEVRSGTSEESCLSLCQTDRECKAFSYFSKNRACFLLTNYDDMRPNDQFTSGILSALPQPRRR